MSKRLHSLHVITGLGTGGAEKMLYKLAQRFDPQDEPMTVVSLTSLGQYGPLIRELGHEVLVHNLKSLRSWIRRIHLSRRPDIIQGWMYHGNLYASFLKSKFTAPVFWNVRQSLSTYEQEKWTTRQVIKANAKFSPSASGIVYNSHLARQQHEAFGFDGRRGVWIPNGFDLPHITKTGGEVLKVIHIGRFHPDKDHKTFLLAVQQVMKKIPQIQVLMAGLGIDEKNPQIQEIIEPENKSRISLLGERRDILELLGSCHLFVSSSKAEAFSNAIGEAMSVGVPCVVTDVGDSAILVGDPQFVVPSQNIDLLAQKIHSILSSSPDHRDRLGQLLRERIKEHYSLAAVAKNYLNLYLSHLR